ncbi:MAG: FAD-dependent oxidoreductase [Gaiellaceae bacterium]
MSEAQSVIVVGAGAAGLACARTLAAAGIVPVVLERDTAPGGRIRTDEVDGFLLDHGFQVLPRAYPEARRQLDFDRLELHDFARGAIVRSDGRFRRVSDPRESPLRSLRSLAGGVVSVRDAAALVKLMRGRTTETTALDALRDAGLSRHAVEAFFAPFLRGIFLEPRLATSSRFLDFVLDAFASAPAALPARGMGAISAQLAEGLDVRTGTAVAAVGPRTVALANGEPLRAAAVVVATAGLVDEPEHGWNGVTCTYFDAPATPLPGAWLVLNGEGGPINNLCVPSEVAPTYAPPGRALVSVSSLGAGEGGLEAVQRQLRTWFGGAVDGWRHLRSYRIPHALPAYPVGRAPERPVRLADGLYACGDHREHPSLNGALASGRRAAEALLLDLPR